MRLKYLSIVLLLFLVAPVNASLLSGNRQLVIKVVDGNITPVKGAKATASFTSYPIDKKVVCLTDDDGQCVIESDSSMDGGIRVTKEGYYNSYVGFEFEDKPKGKGLQENIYQVILKRKRNPVAMYIRNTDWVTIPKTGVQVGYDLEKGDWVSPYGKGVYSDLLVVFNTDYKAYRDYESTLTITFSNEYDGIQEFTFNKKEQSSFRWPYLAPETGYLKKIERFKSDHPRQGIKFNAKKDMNYIFRVRTKTDKDGNIIEARYGKIKGDFQVGRKPQLGILYYFNPNGTRNLEEDPERNLFDKK